MCVKYLSQIRYRLGMWDTEVAMIWWSFLGEGGLVLDAKDYGL